MGNATHRIGQSAVLALVLLSPLTDACSDEASPSQPTTSPPDGGNPALGDGTPIPLDPALTPGNPPPPEGPAIWVGAGKFELVYDTAAQNPSRYINDHTVVKAKDGTWHMFGITSGPEGEVQFAHAIAQNVRGPWKKEADALYVDKTYFKEVHLWAPHVIEDQGTYCMFYAGGERDGNGANAAITVATSTDLFTWTRRPEGPVFRDGLEARDPFVTRIGKQWVMYYTGSTLPNSGQYAVLYRTSNDLIQFYFDVTGYAGHFPSHAAEIIQDGGQWLATGSGTFQRGLYIADLHWRTSPPVWQSRQNPAVARDSTGRLVVFAVSADGKLLLQRREKEPNGDFGDWTTFGDRTGTAPIVVANQNGLLNVFAIDPNGQAVVRRSETAAGTWDAWRPFDGASGALPVFAAGAGGHLEAFALAPAGASIRRAAQSAPNGTFPTDASAWEAFGTATSGPPVVAPNADGRIEVFAHGPDASYIAHRSQAAGGSWNAWETSFGGPAAMTPSLGSQADGRLIALAVSPVGFGLHARSQTTAGGSWGGWTDFEAFGGDAPVMLANPDGRIAPNSSWGDWVPFSGPISAWVCGAPT